jgi:hypothetical protein
MAFGSAPEATPLLFKPVVLANQAAQSAEVDCLPALKADGKESPGLSDPPLPQSRSASL